MSLNRRHVIAGLTGLALPATSAPSSTQETPIARLAREIAVAAPEDIPALEQRLLTTPAEAATDWPVLAQIVARWDRADRPFIWASRQLVAALGAPV